MTAAAKATFPVVCFLLWCAVALNIVHVREHEPHKTDLVINSIAATCYAVILISYSRENIRENVRLVRYADWFITVPLLLVAARQWSQPGEDVFTKNVIVMLVSSCLMILFGFLGKDTFSASYLVGFVFFAVTFYQLYKVMGLNEKTAEEENQQQQQEQKKLKHHPPPSRKRRLHLFLAMTVIWSLYGVAYLLPWEVKTISYNLLDVISKGGFAVWLFLSAQRTMVQSSSSSSSSC